MLSSEYYLWPTLITAGMLSTWYSPWGFYSMYDDDRFTANDPAAALPSTNNYDAYSSPGAGGWGGGGGFSGFGGGGGCGGGGGLGGGGGW